MSIYLGWGYLDHDWAGTGLAAGHCNQGRPQWSLSRVWRVSSSRVEKPKNWRAAERHRRAAPMPIALHAWMHLPLQLDAGSRRAPLYRWSSLCIGAGHTNGPIRFRQQLSSSTSGSAPSLRRQVQRIRGCVFSGHEEAVLPKADRQSRCRQQQPLFWFDFFSGQDGIMQQGRTYNRVPGRASRAQGHPQGAPLRGQTGQDIQADRSVSVNNPPLLPLAMF